VGYSRYKALSEAAYVNLLKDYIAPGTVVIDVGAFVGFFSIRFAKWISAPGRVIAIEPEPQNSAHLRGAVASAKLDHKVECIQAAAADESGELHLKINAACPVDHRLGDEGIPITAITIDGLLASRGWPPVSFIKVDVQGAEAKVIAGAKQTLARFRPALLVEVSDATLRSFGASAEELLATLAGMKYAIHKVEKQSVSQPMTVPEALQYQASEDYVDLLFLPEEGVSQSLYRCQAA
jgi:FkbM family methyltransferase